MNLKVIDLDWLEEKLRMYTHAGEFGIIVSDHTALVLAEVISQTKPIIPHIDSAYDAGYEQGVDEVLKDYAYVPLSFNPSPYEQALLNFKKENGYE